MTKPKSPTKHSPAKQTTASTKARPAWLIPSLIVVGFLIILVGVLAGISSAAAGGTIPGLRVAGARVTDSSADALAKQLQAFVDRVSTEGIVVKAGDRTVTVTSTVSATDDLDLTYEVVSFNVDDTVADALAIGQRGALPLRLLQTFEALVGQAHVPLRVSVDRDRLLAFLQENFGSLEDPAVDPTFTTSTSGVTVTPGRSGQAFDYDAALEEIASDLASGKIPDAVTLTLAPDEPTLTTEEAARYVSSAQAIADAAPYTLTANGQSFSIDSTTVLGWLAFEQRGRDVALTLDADEVKIELEKIAASVNVVAKEGKFTIVGGRVSEFQVGANGWSLDVPASSDAVHQGVFGGVTTIALTGQAVDPSVRSAETGDLGIKELLGAGHSNFAGSPTNRRHNIAVGAAALNGILIKPGEIFSLVKALGAIDASTGYLPELVIKGNKTVPEYGGGLCQIGTTTFRATLASGLPVVERQNHSYRVRYYEPAGTDATIYDPKPDYRFLNDTGHYVLIQTRIEGDELTFEFWGTKDGRVAASTTPVISNIVKAPATKYVETTDLKPGVTKCTESAHNGATAQFTYTITYADGRKEEKVFKSYYKPWQAVCLVGVKKEKEKKPTTPGGAGSGSAGNTNTSSEAGNTNVSS